MLVIDDADDLLRELDAAWEQGGNSRGRRWTREELHERKDAPECEEINIETVSPAEHTARK